MLCTYTPTEGDLCGMFLSIEDAEFSRKKIGASMLTSLSAI